MTWLRLAHQPDQPTEQGNSPKKPEFSRIIRQNFKEFDGQTEPFFEPSVAQGLRWLKNGLQNESDRYSQACVATGWR